MLRDKRDVKERSKESHVRVSDCTVGISLQGGGRLGKYLCREPFTINDHLDNDW